MRPNGTFMKASATPTKKTEEQGLFQHGKWLCNCAPRLPAIRFQVKREGENKGRWFWTCQIDRTKPDKCDFFLWADDAALREETAVLVNSRTQPQTPRKKLKQTTLSTSITPREGPRRTAATGITPISDLPGSTPNTDGSSATLERSEKGDRLDDLGSDLSAGEEDELFRIVDAVSSQESAMASPKRKRLEVDEDEFGDLSSDEERQLAAITDSSSQSQSPQGKQRDAFTTPAAQKTHDVLTGMETPELTDKSVRRVLFAEPEVPTSKKQHVDKFSSFSSTRVEPSPGLTQSSSQEAIAVTPGSAIGNLTEEVMGLLKGQGIDDATLFKVKSALQKHETRAKGLERGRDASREAVKKEKARNAMLQQQIAHFENQRKLDQAARSKMRSELMRIYSEN